MPSVTPAGPKDQCSVCLTREQMEKPATVIVDGVPLCGRCDNKRRAREPHPEAPNGAAAPQAPIVTDAPVVISKSTYLSRFGPNNNRDLVGMIRDLPEGSVMLLPMKAGEGVKAAVRRYRRMLGADSGFEVDGSEVHGHVFVERSEG